VEGRLILMAAIQTSADERLGLRISGHSTKPEFRVNFVGHFPQISLILLASNGRLVRVSGH
jgi:hypothetical protein